MAKNEIIRGPQNIEAIDPTVRAYNAMQAAKSDRQYDRAVTRFENSLPLSKAGVALKTQALVNALRLASEGDELCPSYVHNLCRGTGVELRPI